MKTKGFTLLETMAVTVIISVLAALLFPAMKEVYQSSRRTAALNNLRQLHLAFSLYRTNHDGDGKYGLPTSMGLPNEDELYFKDATSAVAKEKKLWQSPCGTHPDSTYPHTNLYYAPSDRPGDHWLEYVKQNQEQSLLLLDYNCNSHQIPLSASFVKRWCVGVYLSGQAKSKLLSGDLENYPNLNP